MEDSPWTPPDFPPLARRSGMTGFGTVVPRPPPVVQVPYGNRLRGSSMPAADSRTLADVELAASLRRVYTVTELLAEMRVNDCDDDDDDGEDGGGLRRLRKMTAVDFHVDRYARHGVHESEMADHVRTITYKNCIEQCVKHRIRNKVVLVVRCGIGLLPMLCVKMGLAKKVIALEQSSCIEYARRIIKDNHFSHAITLIQSSVHDLKQLPHDFTQVDVIVSDFLGECVLAQGDQMEQVIEARDRFLKPDGLMIPKCVTLYGQLLEQKGAYSNRRECKKKKKNKNNNHDRKPNQNVPQKNMGQMDKEYESSDSSDSSDSLWCSSWWGDVYGFDMRSEIEFIKIPNSQGSGNPNSSKEKWRISPEPIFTRFDPLKVVSNACLIKAFNMYECIISDTRNVQCKNLKLICSTPNTSANGGDYAHVLELFMVVDFPDGQILQNKTKKGISIGFSTSCFSPPTRFQQTGLFLCDQLLVNNRDEFIINEFVMWRGHQKNKKNKLFDTIMSKNTPNMSTHQEDLKIRLRYTFVNKITKAINRRSIHKLDKYIF